MTKPLPCPFCGETEYIAFTRQDSGHLTNLKTDVSMSVNDIHQLTCYNCGARGPEVSFRHKGVATKRWNKRP